MSTPSTPSAPSGGSPSPEAGTYQIRVDGHLDDRWVAWFDGLDLTHEGDGTTTLRGPVVDQTALHGLLQRIRDLGLPLVSVTTIDALHPEGTSS